MFMDFHGAFGLVNKKEEDKYIIWEVVYELWVIYEFYKKISSLVSLIASFEFNDSFGVEFYI